MIKCLLRLTFGVASLASLALLLTVLVLRAQSYRAQNTLTWAGAFSYQREGVEMLRTGGQTLWWARGRFLLEWGTQWGPTVDFERGVGPFSIRHVASDFFIDISVPNSMQPWEGQFNWHGFYGGSDRDDHSTPADGGFHSSIGVPILSVAAVAAVLPAIWIWILSIRIFRAVRRWQRRLAGKCTQCGYDLRATPGKCPECGAEQEGAENGGEFKLEAQRP